MAMKIVVTIVALISVLCLVVSMLFERFGTGKNSSTISYVLNRIGMGLCVISLFMTAIVMITSI